VPAGTRNHFALDLGLDRSDVVGALDAFTDGVEPRIDLAALNGRTFVNNASLELRYTGPDGQARPKAQLILVSNDPYQLDYRGGPGNPRADRPGRARDRGRHDRRRG